MKKKNFSLYLFLFLSIPLFITSCGSDDDNDNEVPEMLYNIVGSVSLYTEDGMMQESNDGMKVSILDKDFNAITDGEGKFTLEEIPEGIYTLVFDKDGYGTYMMFNVDHGKDETTFISNSPSLSEESTTSISLIVTSISDNTVTITSTLTEDANNANPKYVRAFFSKSADLSTDNYEAYSQAYQEKINPFDMKFTTADLEKMGFESGEEVYVNVVGESVFSNDYDNPDLGYRIFPNVNWINDTAVYFEVP